jgi:hypothetical protein
MGFLTQEEVASLLGRLVSYIPSGRSPSTAPPGSRSGRPSTSPAPRPCPSSSSSPASTTLTSPNAGNPRLKLVREILLSREPEVAQFPPVLRLYYRLSALSTAWSRRGTIVLHFRL